MGYIHKQMRVYRVSKKQYADDLAGTGAKLYGGRWNRVNTPCIYTSESRALALLEYTANCPAFLLPKELAICVFEIESENIHNLSSSELPADWQHRPAPPSMQLLGTSLLQKGIPIFRVPSIILPSEHNFILNPMGEKCFRLLETSTFYYDKRIKE